MPRFAAEVLGGRAHSTNARHLNPPFLSYCFFFFLVLVFSCFFWCEAGRGGKKVDLTPLFFCRARCLSSRSRTYTDGRGTRARKQYSPCLVLSEVCAARRGKKGTSGAWSGNPLSGSGSFFFCCCLEEGRKQNGRTALARAATAVLARGRAPAASPLWHPQRALASGFLISRSVLLLCALLPGRAT